ncbi:MAG: hypothetical protein LC742_00170 [Acidobacteria bacterium]|nr:hypothetical protein [Acidobacteriota bacterium]
MNAQDTADLHFFLGGHDLEMQTIGELLRRHVGAARVHDKGLSWGARASDYEAEIRAALAGGGTPVLVELIDDLNLDSSAVITVDHHGARAGKDELTSLEQIFALLALSLAEWTRWFELVAANDKGHVAEMLECGASLDEIKRVRRADRAAQGITSEEEAAAEEAVKRVEVFAAGRLTVVRLAHSRAAAVTDRLERALGGAGYENLLVVSPGQVNFFGGGEMIRALDARFPGGWYGGALPARGFWGLSADELPGVESFLLERLQG